MKKTDWKAIYISWKRGRSPVQLAKHHGVDPLIISMVCERTWLASHAPQSTPSSSDQPRTDAARTNLVTALRTANSSQAALVELEHV